MCPLYHSGHRVVAQVRSGVCLSRQACAEVLCSPDQVKVVFGPNTLLYSQGLCSGDFDYLPRLPDRLLLRILACLELEEVQQLRCASRKFQKLCDSEEFWEQAVRARCDTVTIEMGYLAREVGWKKVFFTNKLQLQKQMSRRRQKQDSADFV
ncbi:hypothetical protein COCON_G00088540 [Conger conger]|uniref:F-box domain-containing protein n=1 Tax=Conger conger TaxID=82655 RepID=A0A9Q1DKS3_CONCO|nr:hypothetical protein COCON_G00088540 [Conger conger]